LNVCTCHVMSWAASSNRGFKTFYHEVHTIV